MTPGKGSTTLESKKTHLRIKRTNGSSIRKKVLGARVKSSRACVKSRVNGVRCSPATLGHQLRYILQHNDCVYESSKDSQTRAGLAQGSRRARADPHVKKTHIPYMRNLLAGICLPKRCFTALPVQCGCERYMSERGPIVFYIFLNILH